MRRGSSSRRSPGRRRRRPSRASRARATWPNPASRFPTTAPRRRSSPAATGSTPSRSRSSSLRGKVVLLDFWTYSCINCLRTLPHLKSWYSTYHRDGLVIIGVHSPEFAFEHVTSNVAAAVKRLGIPYPVMQDNNFATWTNYSNQYWPAEYLIDKQGHLRAYDFGEGELCRHRDAHQAAARRQDQCGRDPRHDADRGDDARVLPRLRAARPAPATSAARSPRTSRRPTPPRSRCR